jgi:hypothetical protein
MVTITTTAATNVSFRARTTTGVTLGYEGAVMPAVRQDLHTDRLGAPVGFGVVCDDAIRVETKGLPSVATTSPGHRAWSPPS